MRSKNNFASGRLFWETAFGLLWATTSDPLSRFQEALLEALGSVLLVLLLLTLSGGLLLSRGFLSRVDAITQTAKSIIEGKLSSRIPLRGTDDHFDRLSRTLNRMLDRINALMESLTHVSAEIAHALRTPLGRLRQKLEAARIDAKRNGQNETLIDAAIAETDTILDTFSALLRIAQIEAATSLSRVSPGRSQRTLYYRSGCLFGSGGR